MITPTPRRIFRFIEGNLKLLGDRLGKLPKHTKEQVLYRSEICKNDCMKRGYCVNCGCKVPGRLYTTKNCNKGNRFPDLMNAVKWEEYKKKNNIDIK